MTCVASIQIPPTKVPAPVLPTISLSSGRRWDCRKFEKGGKDPWAISVIKEGATYLLISVFSTGHGSITVIDERISLVLLSCSSMVTGPVRL